MIQREIHLDCITTSLNTNRASICDSQPFNFDFITDNAIELVYNNLQEIKKALDPNKDEYKNYLRVNIITHKPVKQYFGWITTEEVLIGKKYEYQMIEKIDYKKEFVNHLLVILFELSMDNISWTIEKRKNKKS